MYVDHSAKTLSSSETEPVKKCVFFMHSYMGNAIALVNAKHVIMHVCTQLANVCTQLVK